MTDTGPLSTKINNTTSNPALSPARSPAFYFDCAIFEVENVLYKIPRARLAEESSLFETMFTLPPGAGNTSEGEDDDHPIHLPQTERKDWECLLKLLFRQVLLPRRSISTSLIFNYQSFASNPISGPPEFTLEEWVSILKLATKWDMSTARACAIEKIAEYSGIPAKKIRLARDYRVPRYFIPSLVQLIGRSDPLTADDYKDIGVECALKVVSLRERYYDPNRSEGMFRQQRVASDVSSPMTPAWNGIVSEIHKTFTDHDEFYN
ncbi:hypothetical protein EV359DRAFT_67126 [Lentinula novae-zelandiae]|nr:hypothetical protein EV359DRAFT_67126 [Lentinula novae-zelandiae]